MMTTINTTDLALFNQPEFSFQKIKEQYSPAEVEELKDQFKVAWRQWKAINQTVAKQLPPGLFARPHIESWTNGWQIRDRFWTTYRLAVLAEYNPCLAVLLNRDHCQVYLMFQHYHSQQRHGTAAEYNQLLLAIPEWAKQHDLTNWYLWSGDEMAMDDRLPLSDYQRDTKQRTIFNQGARQTSFMLGKFVFVDQLPLVNVEEFILTGMQDLLPLYQQLI